MDGIPAQLLKEIRPILLNCGPFTSDRQLGGVFVDSRIAHWKSHIIETDNREQRLDMLLEVLSSRSNINGENAFVLFLQVLLDRTHEMDSCHSKLATVIGRLQSDGRSSSTPRSHLPNAASVDRIKLYELLDKSFSIDELNELVFYLGVNYEDLPGNSRVAKLRELILYAERHSKFDILIQTVDRLRPGFFD
jgi:hypothetical protein